MIPIQMEMFSFGLVKLWAMHMQIKLLFLYDVYTTLEPEN